jgi:amino acid adenylation domain-containing protein
VSADDVARILFSRRASLHLSGDDLVLKGPNAVVADTALLDLIKANKTKIIERMRSGTFFKANVDTSDVHPNVIPMDCDQLTPQLLPLVDLTQEEIDSLVERVPGGTRNVQDMYPLLPQQEGVLFHYLTAKSADPYRIWVPMTFASDEALDLYVQALNAVVARHDILRTAIVWDGLREPVQIVWRRAPVVVETVKLAPEAGDAVQQLEATLHRSRYRMDVTQAPLVRMFVAWDATNSRYVGMQLCHHLAVDRTSAEIMNAEIRSVMAGRTTELPRPIPLRNFVVQARSSAVREEHEPFFRDMLGRVNQPTAPFGLLEAHGDGTQIAEAYATLDADLANRVRTHARRLGVSAASLFHVAFALVLARTSDQKEPVFGTVLFGRMNGLEGIDRTIGPFIKVLPIVVRLGGITVEACIRRTHELLADLLQHEHARLVEVQRYSNVPPPAPLFTALFNYRYGMEIVHQSLDVDDLEPTVQVADDVPNNYALTVKVDDLRNGFSLTTQITAAASAVLVSDMMICALEGVVAAIEETTSQPVSQLDVLPRKECERLSYAWNDTQWFYPKNRVIHDLFEEQATKTPSSVALVDGNRRLTYRQLDESSNQFAHWLVSLGVRPDSVVALCMERSSEMVVALFGILKAGGAYLPLDPKYPAQRLRFMLQDSDAEFLISSTEAISKLPQSFARVIIFDDLSDIAEQPVTRPLVRVTQENLAYVIYTSGSTGQPKGVLGLHRAIFNRLFSELPLAAGGGVYAMKTTINFIDALWEIFMPLISGGVVVLIPHEEVMDPARLATVLKARLITHLVLVPSLLNELLTALDHNAITLSELRYCSCGGEVLPTDVARRFTDRLPGAKLVNFYGATEFWDAASYSVNLSNEETTVPIGRPTPNQRIYVLDAELRASPLGVAGELHVAGDGLSRGYINRPDITAQRFVPCPFGSGFRMYRTGDLAKWREDGQLELLGRVDRQVKVRGHRVELEEVESALREHPGVSQAAVVARNDDIDTILVAYIVPSSIRATARGSDGEASEVDRSMIDAEDLSRYLSGVLPQFMVPEAFVVMTELPLTPSGKLNRQALPPPRDRVGTTHSYVAPSCDRERQLAEIWANVLGCDRVSINDSFFKLGGNSIDAIRMINAVKKSMGMRISYRMLYEKETIASLCKAWVA